MPLLTAQEPRRAPRYCEARVINVRPIGSYNSRTGAGFLAVRAGPSSQSAKISELYLGDRVRVTDQSGNWAKVTCISGFCLTPYQGRGGVTGWSSKKYLSISCN